MKSLGEREALMAWRTDPCNAKVWGVLGRGFARGHGGVDGYASGVCMTLTTMEHFADPPYYRDPCGLIVSALLPLLRLVPNTRSTVKTTNRSIL